ncbi:PRC-barrel domain-containing protein [Lutimaribacter marinistellae]|uniref:PRC-barrel domain-containing protein n=1 Tax=Lutimaribacter marinistellae TaxID=1820329 RepID=A0ABV7TJ13_9RHOB
MKNLTISAIALTIAAAPVFADNHSTMDKRDSMKDVDYAELIRTRDITGGQVYTTNEAHDEGEWGSMAYETLGDDWNQIGEIEDVVLDKNGQMIGIVAEVGGFLDIGDKHVMLKIDEAKLVPVDDRSYAIVTRLNEEDLEAREGVDEGWWD